MKQLQKKLLKNPVIRFLSSLQITVACLSLFFILTFWGTVYQADHGLYESQVRFFNSFYFFVFEVIPLPGLLLVLWVLFVNLIAATFTRFNFIKKNLGILVIHVGILSFFLAAFAVFYLTTEANVSFVEGEGKNVAESYQDWEVSVWQNEEGSFRDVTAYEVTGAKPGTQFSFEGFDLITQFYFKNSAPYSEHAEAFDFEFTNVSEIKYLSPSPKEKEPEKNFPGAVFEVRSSGETKKILLFGGEQVPTSLEVNGEKYFFQLRRKRLPLPFTIKLIDFRKEVHPGTEMARSFESTVEIDTVAGKREVIISMNEPLRYKNITMYQASYGEDGLGREVSVLATVKNSGRVLPYVSSFLTFFGLAIHFIMMFVGAVKKKRK